MKLVSFEKADTAVLFQIIIDYLKGNGWNLESTLLKNYDENCEKKTTPPPKKKNQPLTLVDRIGTCNWYHIGKGIKSTI